MKTWPPTVASNRQVEEIVLERPGQMKWGFALWLAFGVSTLGPRVHAAPSSRLVYSRAEEANDCPDVSAFRKAVAARVGYDPFFPWAEIAVTATIQRDARSPRRLVGNVALVDADGIVRGSREIIVQSGDCAELVSSMALAVSIALDSLGTHAAPPDPEGVQRLAEPAPEAPSRAAESGPSSSEVVHDADAVSKSPPDRSAPRRLSLAGVGLVGTAGSTPSPTAGISLMGGLRYQFFALELEGRAHLPASTDGPVAGGVRATLLSGSLLPCLHAGVAFGCAVMSLQYMRAEGFGVPTPEEASAAFGAAGARAGIELAFGERFAGRGYAEIGVPIASPTLRLGGVDTWSPSTPSGSLGISVVAKFL